MYLNYYQLKQDPFHITPDPDFLFLSPSHREALASIMYGIEKRKGFIAITGEVGVGKTTVLRSYLEKADKRQIRIIYLFNANLSFRSLLKSVCKELQLDTGEGDVPEMVDSLHWWLVDEYRQNRNVAVIIDEAQNMPIDTLENLRMLSNMETATDKLIQIVLIGQPELEEKLKRHELRQLNQRIVIRAAISPLTAKESLRYIRHRLARAGMNGAPVFTARALNRIVNKAEGIPRVLNILCSNALITGYGYQKATINSGIIKEVISDTKAKAKAKADRLRFRVVPLAALVLIAIALAAYSYQNRFFFFQEPQMQVQVRRAAPVEGKKTVGLKEEAGQKQMKDPVPVSRVVKRGDTLSGLAEDIYGFSNYRLIDLIKRKNPRIHDENQISIGSEIRFPDLDRDNVKVTRKGGFSYE